MGHITELKSLPTYKELPDCVHEQVGQIRCARFITPGTWLQGGHRTEHVLQALYEDGAGALFWGPLPVVDNPEYEDES